MWKDILKGRKYYGRGENTLINEVHTGKIVGAKFKKVKELLADEDFDVRFLIEIKLGRTDFRHILTIKAKTFTEFLKELATNITRFEIPFLNRQFNKNKDIIRIYSEDM